MKRSVWLCASAALLLLALPFILGSCVLPGTGSINVINALCWGKEITALSEYPPDTPGTNSVIYSPLEWLKGYLVTGVAPGWWMVHAVIDNGSAAAEKKVLVVLDEITSVRLRDGDII
jgi:hypothetical protein